MTKFVSIQIHDGEGSERTLLINAAQIRFIAAVNDGGKFDHACVELTNGGHYDALNEWFDLLSQLEMLGLVDNGGRI